MCRIRQFARAGLCLALAGASCVASLAAQEPPPPPWETHPWAKFGVGSWKQVRVYHESIDEVSQVRSTSVTSTRTTLVEVSDSGYVLQVEVDVEVAGKRFNSQPKLMRQGFNGEADGQTVEVQAMGPGELVIDGQKYPTELRKVVINGDEFKRVSVMHYNEQFPPHVLRRDTKATDASGTKPDFESTVEVLAIDMPRRVLNETKLVSDVKTTLRKSNGGTTVTLEVVCRDVPGGVTAHSTKELNPEGRVIARSTLELIDYQVVPLAEESDSSRSGRRRVFHRSRGRGTGN